MVTDKVITTAAAAHETYAQTTFATGAATACNNYEAALRSAHSQNGNGTVADGRVSFSDSDACEQRI